MNKFPWENHPEEPSTEPKKTGRKPKIEERTERLDMRLTKSEKKKLRRKAAANKCTITDVVSDLIARMD